MHGVRTSPAQDPGWQRGGMVWGPGRDPRASSATAHMGGHGQVSHPPDTCFLTCKTQLKSSLPLGLLKGLNKTNLSANSFGAPLLSQT